MWMRSLRLRLLVFAALTIGIGLTATGGALVLVFERHLLRRIDQELQVKMIELVAALGAGDGVTVPPRRALADPRYERPLSGAYWQIDEKGQTIARSRSLWDERIDAGADNPAGDDEPSYERAGPGGAELYILARSITVGEGSEARRLRVAVAIDHAELQELSSSFRADVMFALTVIATILLAGAWAQILFGLAPLAKMRQALDRVRAGAAKRLGEDYPTEVAPLARDLDALIEHQSVMIARARERAGALAHGLKTPLTILSAEAARLARAGRRAEAEVIQAQIKAMRGHVERELARARTHGASAGGGIHADVERTAAKLIAIMRKLPRGAEIDWRVAVPAAGIVPLDSDDLGEVLGNLLDNARKWARGTVVLSVIERGGVMEVFVEDDGPGVPAAIRHRVIDRGFQADPDREGDGVGLGVAAEVLAEYGCRLLIEERPGGGARIGFRVPDEGPARIVAAREESSIEGPAAFAPAMALPPTRP